MPIKYAMNLFSGEVDSGKTFDMRAYTHAIPKHSRIVTIEDMHEMLQLPVQTSSTCPGR